MPQKSKLVSAEYIKQSQDCWNEISLRNPPRFAIIVLSEISGTTSAMTGTEGEKKKCSRRGQNTSSLAPGIIGLSGLQHTHPPSR
jgi:hypothetical protein